MTSEPSLQGRLCLITGATRGLGRAVALRYAREGAHLILLGRTPGALEELDDFVRALGAPQPVLVAQDLAEHDKLDALGAALFERFGKLDVLVGNAAILGELSPIGHLAPVQWKGVFDVNVTANYRLLRSLDPLLRRAEAGRVIMVTDRTPQHRAYWSCYAASKAALETLTLAYAEEVAKTTITANLVSPPPMATRLRTKAFPGEAPNKQPAPEMLTDIFVTLALSHRSGEVVAA